MISIAVVDDEKSFSDQLTGFIQRYAKEQNLDVQVTVFQDGMEIADDFRSKWDIIFLDIQMQLLDGLSTARRIRACDQDVIIIFVTTMAQYAINGYEVDAVDYIIKPVGYYDFAMKFQKAVRRAGRTQSNWIVIDTVNGPVGLSTDSIQYVEVMAHYVIYHTAEQTYRVRASMKEHEDALRPYHFARCHKSYLINLKHLKSISASDVIVDDLSIPLGRAYKDDLLYEYMKYLHR